MSVDASLDLTGKIALVTGGSRGIGRSVVDTFLQQGAQAVTCGRGDRPADLNQSIAVSYTHLTLPTIYSV